MENDYCTGNANHSNTKDSVTLAVSNISEGTDVIIFEDFPLSTTISHLKLQVLEEMAKGLGIQDFRRIGDPESLLFEVNHFKHGKFLSKRSLSIDDDQSLRDFLSSAGYYPSYSSHIHLRIAPQWIRFLQKVLPVRADERELDLDFDRCYVQSGSGSDSDYEDYEFPDVDSRTLTQRPQDLLPENMDVLQVVGKLVVNDRLPEVGYIGGLQCNLKDVETFSTPANHVVLVFSVCNLHVFKKYHAYLDGSDMDGNPNDKILCLLVTWDKFSYLFLRKLRKSIGSQVPIIAFTDCNVHQVDLLTFLDTPPEHLAECYGWGDLLKKDTADLGIGDVVVDIKWGGVRPSELKLLSISPDEYARYRFSFARVGDVYLSTIYDKVYGFLKNQNKWPEEMQEFEKRRYSIPLMCIVSKVCPSYDYVWTDYLQKKFDEKDWS